MNRAMRALIVAAVLVVVGMVGLVVHSEMSKGERAPRRAVPGGLIETISHGEAVSIEAHLTAGQWTVVEFYADF